MDRRVAACAGACAIGVGPRRLGYGPAVRKGPFADSYLAAVALVACSLIPYLALTASVLPVLPQVGKALHLSAPTLDLAVAMSTAGYAVGTVFAVEFAVRLPPRRMLVIYGALFVVASLLAATTSDGGASWRLLFWGVAGITVLAFAGMLCIIASSAVFLAWATSGSAVVAVGTGLLGLGVGVSVSPALFMAGFSLKSSQLQRVFALIELLRGVTAFLVAPVLLYLVTVLSAVKTTGVHLATWICLGLAAAGFILALGLYASGKGGLEAPDIDRWQEHGEPAWSSPPLLSRLRAPAYAER